MIRAIIFAGMVGVALASPSVAMNCETEFRVRVDQMMSKQTLSLAEKIEITQFALKGAEACMKGDMNSAKTFFDKAAKMSS